MFKRISNTWAIMGASLDVLKKDPELLLFPLLSAIALIIVTASFIAPLFLTGAMNMPEDGRGNIQISGLYYIFLFAFYFCNYFVITFFNTAIVASAIEQLNGGNPTLGSALGAAISRLPQVLAWALMAATVGFVLRMIEERSKLIGKIVAGLLGAAWSITTFLVIPILVVEKMGPIDAFKRSTSLLKQTWGEQLVSGFSFGVIFMLLSLPAVGLIIFSAASGSGAFMAVVIGVSIMYFILLALLSSALQTIFQAVLYVYATGGNLPPEFSRDIMAGAITPK